jgi:hypothetical protein
VWWEMGAAEEFDGSGERFGIGDNMNYSVVLRNLKNETEEIVLDTCANENNAEQQRKNWRRVLGNKNWTINRRPGLDTLDHLTLSIRKSS